MQWLVEEALMERLERHGRDIENRAAREHGVSAAQQRVRDRLDAARGGK